MSRLNEALIWLRGLRAHTFDLYLAACDEYRQDADARADVDILGERLNHLDAILDAADPNKPDWPDVRGLLSTVCWQVWEDRDERWARCVKCHVVSPWDLGPLERNHDVACPIGMALSKRADAA